MNLQLQQFPDFQEGIHYRRLSHQEGRGIYRFATLRCLRYHIPGIIPRGKITFHDAAGRQWFQIDKFGCLVAEDYAWNGCSPKRWVPLLGWIGTPDLTATIPASCLHDPLYQFHATRHFPLHRSECDHLFKQAIEHGGEDDIAGIYYTAVRKFGAWSPTAPEGQYSVFTP